MDRDPLVPIRHLGIKSNTVASLELFDLIHFTLDRFGPELITILSIDHVGFLDITRNAHSELVSDLILASLARIDHAFHNLEVATHAVQLLPSLHLEKVIIVSVHVESDRVRLDHSIERFPRCLPRIPFDLYVEARTLVVLMLRLHGHVAADL